MEEKPDASESDAAEPDPSPEPSRGSLRSVRASRALASLARIGPRPPSRHIRLRPVDAVLTCSSSSLRLATTPCAGAMRWSASAVRAGCSTAATWKGAARTPIPTPTRPREVTGFEVELMALLGRRARASSPSSRQGQWDKLLQVLDSGRIDAGRQRLRVDRDPGPRLPGDPALLRLPAPADGPRGRPGPLAGPTSSGPGPAAGAGRSACWSARRPTPSPTSRAGPNVRGRPVRRRDRRDDGRAERPVSTPRSRTCPRRASTATGSPASSWPARPSRHGYYVIYVRTRRRAPSATRSTGASAG